MIWYLCSCDFQAGGSVSSNGRLQGRLEVSRAFGDRQFKKVLSASTLHSWHCSFMFSIYVWWQHLYICPCYVAGNETWFKEKYNAIACMQAYRSRDNWNVAIWINFYKQKCGISLPKIRVGAQIGIIFNFLDANVIPLGFNNASCKQLRGRRWFFLIKWKMWTIEK